MTPNHISLAILEDTKEFIKKATLLIKGLTLDSIDYSQKGLTIIFELPAEICDSSDNKLIDHFINAIRLACSLYWDSLVTYDKAQVMIENDKLIIRQYDEPRETR